MKPWGGRSFLGQGNDHVISRRLESLNPHMNIELVADLQQDMGAEESLHPSVRQGGKGNQP